jgi:hypothetical protein
MAIYSLSGRMHSDGSGLAWQGSALGLGLPIEKSADPLQNSLLQHLVLRDYLNNSPANDGPFLEAQIYFRLPVSTPFSRLLNCPHVGLSLSNRGLQSSANYSCPPCTPCQPHKGTANSSGFRLLLILSILSSLIVCEYDFLKNGVFHIRINKISRFDNSRPF